MVHGTKDFTILENSASLSFSHFSLSFNFSYVNTVLVHVPIFLKFLKLLSFIGSKIVGKGATILGGLAKILNRTLKG